VEVLTPAPREEWSAIVASSDATLAFQRPDWMDAICASGGYADASRLYVMGGARLLLPLARRTGVLGAAGLVASLPYGWGFGGLVAQGEIGPEDVAAVVADLARQRWARVSIRPDPLAAAPWNVAVPRQAVRVARRAHVLDLQGGFETVWTRAFTGVARTNVRRAERSGLAVECGHDVRAIDAFHGLYERSVERWARQAGPAPARWWIAARRERRAKFERAAAALGDDLAIWVARLDARPIAAIIVLRAGASASYWRGAMDEEAAGPTRANYLLHRLAIEDACLAGCRRYHMGETGTSASLAQFKTRFGAIPHDYHEYRLERLPLTATASLARRLAVGAIGLVNRRPRPAPDERA